MIRWKILRQKIKRIALASFGLFLSCSEGEPFEQDVLLEISEKKEFKVGWDGLYHNYLTAVVLDSLGKKGLIYNYINHSLDSIFISADSVWSKTGESMQYEGPYGVGKINSFFAWKDSIVLFTNSELFFRSRKTGEVRKKLLINYPLFRDKKFDHITTSGIFENRFHSLDTERGIAYFSYSNSIENRFGCVRIDLNNDVLEDVPLVFDSEKLKEKTLSLKITNGSLSSPDDPAILFLDGKLFFSYPTFNEILTFNLQSNEQEVYFPSTSSFPSQRTKPAINKDNLEINEAIELNSAWQNQVTFGPLVHLKDSGRFIRLVSVGSTEGSEKSGQLFVEFFSKDLQKIEEQNISLLNPDLGGQYIQTKYGLIIKAIDQPKEDRMYFYFLNFRSSK